MKKIICTFLGILLIGAAFCQENEKPVNTENIKAKVNFLIDNGLMKNQGDISTLSFQLDDSQKMDLFSEYKKTPMKPILFNTLVGFGIGSYLDGDKLGGIVGTCLDGAASTVWIIAAISYKNEMKRYENEYENYLRLLEAYEEAKTTPSVPGKVNMNAPSKTEVEDAKPKWTPQFHYVLPLIISVSARVYEGVRASSYVKKYNKTLASSLGLTELRTSLLPTIDSNGNLAMTFNINLML